MRWANLPRLNTSTTEQAQTPAFPSGLHTITQTHHDEHNYWAHMALCFHQLMMSTQKATDAGIPGWDKEQTPWDGGNLHPLTNLPTGNLPVPPHSPIRVGEQSLPAHISLAVLRMLQVCSTGPVDPIPSLLPESSPGTPQPLTCGAAGSPTARATPKRGAQLRVSIP